MVSTQPFNQPVILPAKKKRKKSENLVDTTLSVLRGEVERLESKLRGVERELAAQENLHSKLERRANSAEESAEVLLEAVRVLAKAIPPDTAQGRRVRQEARVLLEAKKITPPSSLGSSRNRPKKRS